MENSIDNQNNQPESEESGQQKNKPKKDSLLTRIKKLFAFRISIRRVEHPARDGQAPDGGEPAAAEEKQKKEKKPKPPKPKKQPKPPKDKKTAPADGEKKRKIPLVAILAAAGVIVVGGGVFAAVTILGNNSPEKQLAKADALMLEQKYDEASVIYNKLVEKDPAMADAYLGQADALVAMGSPEQGVETLKAGLEPTGNDPRIQSKIDALSPHEEQSSSDGEGPPPEGPVQFADAEFGRMLRIALGKPESAEILASELAGIKILKIVGSTHAATDEIVPTHNEPDGYVLGGVKYTDRGGIRRLDDLKYFTGLRKLTIAYNQVEDISGIAGLTSLETLGLYFNDIRDIGPVSGLKSLRFLYLYGNRITDISAVAGLPSLYELFLQHNEITDISAVAKLSELTQLFIGNNQVKDISAVKGLSELGFIYADNNAIEDISALEGLEKLTDVSFIGNPVKDYTPAGHVQHVNQTFA